MCIFHICFFFLGVFSEGGHQRNEICSWPHFSLFFKNFITLLPFPRYSLTPTTSDTNTLLCLLCHLIIFHFQQATKALNITALLFLHSHGLLKFFSTPLKTCITLLQLIFKWLYPVLWIWCKTLTKYEISTISYWQPFWTCFAIHLLNQIPTDHGFCRVMENR